MILYIHSRNFSIYQIQAMDQNLMEKFKCVSPIHTNLPNERQCTLNSSMRNPYIDFLRSDVFDSYCSIPCASMGIIFQTSNIEKPSMNEAQVKFYFKTYIKKNSSFWSYSLISLLGEVGGYVGLLLGISVLDVAKLFGNVFNVLTKDVTCPLSCRYKKTSSVQ